MKLLIGGKTRNIYKRKDGSAYYKSGGQQVDITHMFKKKGGGLKKKYIKGGTPEQEFNDLKQKCIELHKRLNELYNELKDYDFSFITSNSVISNIIRAYYESSKPLQPLHQLANEINEYITKVYSSKAIDKYKPLMTELSRVINHLTDENDKTTGTSKIREDLKVMSHQTNDDDKKTFDDIKRAVLDKLSLIIGALAPIIRKDFQIGVVEEEETLPEIEKKDDITNTQNRTFTLEEDNPDEEQKLPQEDQDGIKSITFEPIKINSKEIDNKKALKEICCLALYGLAAGMTDMLKVNLKTSENKDKIKVLNKIKDTQQFINHLFLLNLTEKSYNTLSIYKNPTVEDINRVIKPFGFLNYNEGDGDGVFVTRAYILNKILQCFEGEDYIASSKSSVKPKLGKLVLNGKKIVIDPEKGIMESINDKDLSQLFNNIHTIVKLTNVGSADKINISFSNLYYVLFSEEDIGSSQTVIDPNFDVHGKKLRTNNQINKLAEIPRDPKNAWEETSQEIPSTAKAKSEPERKTVANQRDGLKQLELLKQLENQTAVRIRQDVGARNRQREELRKKIAEIDKRPSTAVPNVHQPV